MKQKRVQIDGEKLKTKRIAIWVFQNCWAEKFSKLIFKLSWSAFDYNARPLYWNYGSAI